MKWLVSVRYSLHRSRLRTDAEAGLISPKILELNRFMSVLLKSDFFDDYLLKEANIKALIEYDFDGHIFKDYLSEEEKESGEYGRYIKWKNIKETAFNLIKGKKMPLGFSFLLIFPEKDTERLIKDNGLLLVPENNPRFYIRISFEHGEGRILTGMSSDVFSLDKAPMEAWDLHVRGLLKTLKILTEE